jgi:quercetin dioxygenase-like cupin family protein
MEDTATKVFIYDEKEEWEQPAPGIKRKIIAYDQNLMMVRMEFETGVVGVLHSHHHSQISLVESGRFEVEISGEIKIMEKGDAFYVPPHVTHGAVCLEPGVLVDAFSPMREDYIKMAILATSMQTAN